MPKKRSIGTPKKGDRFGKLSFLYEVIINGERYWKCSCDCGNTTSRAARSILRSFKASSFVGCVKCRSKQKRNRYSNFEKMNEKKLMERWRDCHRHMLRRCFNESDPAYRNYGARGITVSHKLINPKDFCSYIMSLKGWDNLLLSLDRINNNGNYEPGNLRMATNLQQTLNRRPKEQWSPK